MRILLVSDTHGNLDIINQLVDVTNSDLVIHAGDFGFYDENSYSRLSTRELMLLAKHSYKGKFSVDKQTDRDVLIKIVKENKLLGTFTDYLDNQKQFNVPVYAVYGNHEDVSVIRALKENKPIENLNLLDEDNIYSISENDSEAFRIFGLGGNFLVGQKLLRKPIAGNAGKVWSTLHQFGALYQNLKNKSKPSIFVSHVSPGKESLLTRLIIHFMPKFWISGHMGAPYACIWNQFTIRKMEESLAWFDSELSLLDKLSLDNMTPEAQLAYDLMKREIQRDEYWYKKLWNINLPDAKDGYAVLNYSEERFCLESFSTH